MEPRKSILETVKPANALGTLGARSSMSRTGIVIGAVAILFAFLFAIFFLIGGVSGEINDSTPSITR